MKKTKKKKKNTEPIHIMRTAHTNDHIETSKMKEKAYEIGNKDNFQVMSKVRNSHQLKIAMPYA